MRVLVVEDEVRLAAAIRSGLDAEGFVVDAVHDGTEGLRQATARDYDVIVLDILLPGINGYQVCSRLRERGVWTPILMLTAKDGEYDEADALDVGADDYVSKPFSFVVLVARLRALVRRGGKPRPAALRVDDLHLDPATGICRRGGQEIALTAKEFTVLELLARRHGQVVSKREILAGCWDFAYEGDPNVVEVHISALRRKIDAPFDRRSIRTVRGMGYRLTSERGRG
ncbi:response regulator transcription factor [Saccharopolyspora erythraea]|uniref:response regulator transcription factor n=1 Tax=Saccharopolyspora erythraea TaxID=1836 RepID=UPI001BA4DC58|nr:response regulator transcription factor [Saccharopolyspora erythraea]QUH04788.1 response regulator transcription factor [Saccharopolyspora erythraea]